MRICLISREYPPDTGWGGIGSYTFQHARALKEQGHDVEVISLSGKDFKEDSRSLESSDDPLFVPVHRAEWGSLLQEFSTIWISLPYSHFALKSCLALWRKFLEIHTAKPFDVVEAPEHLAEALFPALTRLCPLIIRLHTPHSKFIKESYHNLNESFDHQLVSILERTAMLEADLLSSPSRDLARYISEDAGIEFKSIKLVPNPVDCRKFAPEGSAAIAPDGRVTVFFAGRLEERKGIHYLIDAIPEVLESFPNARFVIVGADTNTGHGQTSVLEALKKKLAENGSEKSVQFINHVPLDQMPAHYRSADICVVPSLYENAPYTVLEAQASGKAVVGTSAGGSKEYIADGLSGFVVPARDSKALAEKIIELAKNPDLRMRMGIAARELSLEKFDRSIIAKQAIATYEQAIAMHAERVSAAIYRRDPEESLIDFISLLYAYHTNLCDLIYRHSLSFRLSYWGKLALMRPRLFAAKVAVAMLNNLNKTFSFAPRKLDEIKMRIEKQVKEREAERNRLIVEQILDSCRIN